jgi:hypothetical protein
VIITGVGSRGASIRKRAVIARRGGYQEGRAARAQLGCMRGRVGQHARGQGTSPDSRNP